MLRYAEINLIVYAIVGIFVLKYGKKCKTEHDELVSEVEFYVSESLQRWKVGRLFWLLGILQLIMMMVFVRFEMFVFFSPFVTILEWGISCELWKRYKTIVIYVKEDNLYYFEKKKWHFIPIGELCKIVPWVGNIAFTLFNEQNEKIVDVYARYDNAQLFLRELSERIS